MNKKYWTIVKNDYTFYYAVCINALLVVALKTGVCFHSCLLQLVID